MKRLLAVACFLSSIFISTQSVYAGVCLDFTSGIARYQESSRVLSLQEFLKEKGFLTAKPNGYYGNGTFAAVKSYQKSIGLSQVGNVGPGTRAAIKKETCSGGITSKPQPIVATSTPKVVTPPVVTKTPTELRNTKRREDITILISALGRRFLDTRGAHSITTIDTPTELCVKPAPVVSTATATEVAVLTTPDSLCKDYIDVSYLSSYLPSIPRDPMLATSSTLTGYTISRSEGNDITITTKNPEDKAIIKVMCNFNTGCQKIEQIGSIIYTKPYITSIDKTIFLRDSTPKDPITITGKGFTTKNKISLISSYSSKEYYLGEFGSLNGTTTLITATSVNQFFPCGGSCSDQIPLGDYSVILKNEGGTSNLSYISIKGYTTSSYSANADTPVRPKSTAIKLGTISVSAAIPITFTSLTLRSTSTAKNLPNKITKFVLKDQTLGTSITGSGSTFGLQNVNLYPNQTKSYDIYADIDEVFVADTGFITYGGEFIVKDPLLNSEITLPIKDFSFTVSY